MITICRKQCNLLHSDLILTKSWLFWWQFRLQICDLLDGFLVRSYRNCAQHSNNRSDLFLLNRFTFIKLKAFVIKVIWMSCSKMLDGNKVFYQEQIIHWENRLVLGFWVETGKVKWARATSSFQYQLWFPGNGSWVSFLWALIIFIILKRTVYSTGIGTLLEYWHNVQP